MEPTSAPTEHAVMSRAPGWFYVWCLPILWTFPVATLWSMTILESDPHFGIVIALAEWPVLWLVDPFLLSLGSPWSSSNVVAAVATCVIGTGAMGMVGLVQDLLQVPRPRRTAAVYLIAVLASFLLMPYILWLVGVSGLLAVMLPILVAILVVFSNLVFVFGIGSVVVYALLAIVSRAFWSTPTR
jgi:hypothetical protein